MEVQSAEIGFVGDSDVKLLFTFSIITIKNMFAMFRRKLSHPVFISFHFNLASVISLILPTIDLSVVLNLSHMFPHLRMIC